MTSIDAFQRVDNVTSVSVKVLRHVGDGTLELRRDVLTASAAPPPTGDAPRYLLLDAVVDHYDEALGQWHASCAVFLARWAELLARHPALRRPFKRQALALYGVPPDRVLLEREMAVPNVCLLPPSLMTSDAKLDVAVFMAWWDAHVDAMRAAAGASATSPKSLPVLVLPRPSRPSTSATASAYGAVSAWAEALGGRTLRADGDADLAEQIRTVDAARSLVCDCGSAFFVHASLARDADIFALGSLFMVPSSVAQFNRMRARGNRVHFVDSLADVPQTFWAVCAA
jgi:hypothetical protein